MGFILGTFGFLVLLALFARIWPLLLLGTGLVVAHGGGKLLHADWHDWEWGLVALALVLQAALFTSKAKLKTASRK